MSSQSDMIALMPKTDTARGVHSGHRAFSLRFRLITVSCQRTASRHGGPREAGTGGHRRAAPRHRKLLVWRARDLHDRDAGVITTINDPHGNINSEPKQFCSFGAAYRSLAARANPSTPLIPVVVISPLPSQARIPI